MSLDAKQTEDRPLTGIDDLLAYFRSAERAGGQLLVGLEHEKLLFPVQGIGPVPYDGPSGIGALLRGFGSTGWKEFREAPELPVIAMTKGAQTISLEPGGQFEHSGSPFPTARAAHEENLAHLAQLGTLAGALGLRSAALGYRPFGDLAGMPWMPKTRYTLMQTTLGTRGTHAHHMMLMTATGQASFDWRDEADCARKMTVAARIAPIVVALFANSPIVEGKPSGFKSFRSRVWNDVDPARCGFPTCTLDGTFSYRAYVEWALDAPMLFLRRGGLYLDTKMTFRQLLARGWQGQPAQHSDWVDHLSTLFPEVRIKKVLEIRSADANNGALTGALTALMRGLLYDPTALDEAGRVLPKLSLEEHLALHRAAQKEALAAKLGRTTLAPYARELVQIADAGLARLDPLDRPLLAPLQEIAASGRCPAEAVLEAHGTLSPSAFLDRFPV